MKKWSALVLSAVLSAAAQAQIKPTLTILPFNERTGEEEAAASLLSQQPELNKTFDLVPCAETFSRLALDLEGGTYTAEEDLAYEVRSRLAADFAVIVWAGKAGGENLCLFSLIDMKDFRLTAGAYRKYTGPQDLSRAMPAIAEKMRQGMAAPQGLPKISALPFAIRPDTQSDGAILFQLMNIELANSALYAVYPWSMTIASLLRGRNIQYAQGVADPAALRDAGHNGQIRYALTGALVAMETSRLFLGSLMDTENAEFIAGGQIEYASIAGDLEPLAQFARSLAAQKAGGAGKPGLPSSGAFAGTKPPQENAPPPARASGSGSAGAGNPPPAQSAGDAGGAVTEAAPEIIEIKEIEIKTTEAKPTLTVLPFSDKAGGDQETIAILLANQEALRRRFTVLPAAGTYQSVSAALLRKTYPHREAFDEALRKSLRADFTLIVRAEKTGSSSVFLASLVQMQDLRQIAGHYQRYPDVRNVVKGLPDLAGTIAGAAGKAPDPNLPKLAALPFYTPAKGRTEERDAEMLFQYLAIELTNSGKYAVYPWELPIQTLISGFTISYFGIIDPERISAFGKAAGIPYMLTGDLLNLGTGSLFMSSIVHTGNAGVLARGDLEYRIIMEDPQSLAALAGRLTQRTKAESTALDPGPPRAAPVTPPAPRLPQPPQGRFVKISGGTFTMGTPASEAGRDQDEIQRRTTVRDFYLSACEVTQEEYEAVMGVNPSYFKSPTSGAYPVEQVSWFEAVEYCNKRSLQEGLTPAYVINRGTVVWNQSADGYRLPTEAEWEYACRAGTTAAFYTGARFTADEGNYDGTYTYNRSAAGVYRERPTPAGSFKPNSWGLFDMHGNVYEWCWDWYRPYDDDNARAAPPGHRIIRGGSWYSAPRYLRSGNRAQAAPEARAYYLGFRLARSE
ncbi:MAG: formylglycine-generating enzyme family protein [Spirochaetaceae bacterium]|jgi:formylglycine-generating enzyme required for sulfatase activity|nr:formylglycine-generating enzyme family protein [Spirochaetaceae bacterium]